MEKYCIKLNYTIKEAIEQIDLAKNRVVIVLNEDSKVVGVISQGDIIRALSAGKNLYARIETMLRPDFLYMNEKNMEKAYHIFKKTKITLMPIVDQYFNLVDIINMDDIYNYLEERCNI